MTLECVRLSKKQPEHWEMDEIGWAWSTENAERRISRREQTESPPWEVRSVLDTYCRQVALRLKGRSQLSLCTRNSGRPEMSWLFSAQDNLEF